MMFLIHSLALGGAERVTANLANYWASLGRDVVVVTMDTSKSDFYRLDANIVRISLNLAGESSSSLAGAERNIRRIFAIRETLRSQQPDVAIAVMSSSNVLLAIAGVGLGITKIGTEHNFPPRSTLTSLWRHLRTFTYGWLDSVVALTSESAIWLDRNTNAKRITVIANPLSMPLPRGEPLVTVDSIGLREGDKFALCIARLIPLKRVERAIEAYASQAPAFPDWKLVILGDGPQRAALVETARNLGIEERVKFVGVVGNAADWLRACSLFVMSSHTEGFPNTLLEAMAHGVACVSVDCDTGPRDMIRSGINGVLVPQDDLAALSCAIGRLMGDEEERKRLGERASDIAKRFSIGQISQQWDTEFQLADSATRR